MLIGLISLLLNADFMVRELSHLWAWGMLWFPLLQCLASALTGLQAEGFQSLQYVIPDLPPEVWAPTSTSHSALPSLCHFLHKVRLRGAVGSEYVPTSLWVPSRPGRVLVLSFGSYGILQPKYLWNSSGAELGPWVDALPNLSSQLSFEFTTRGRSMYE